MARRTDLHVLVVDDMSVSRQILTQMLERLGVMEVMTAGCGGDALATLARRRVDVLITDLNMPDMNGTALVASARRIRRARSTRFILTSGDFVSASTAEHRQLGIDAVLVKPFRIDALLDAIEVTAGRI